MSDYDPRIEDGTRQLEGCGWMLLSAFLTIVIIAVIVFVVVK
jgi:hypothetical protein